MTRLEPQTLTPEAFAPFGDVIRPGTVPARMINEGKCARFHDLAKVDCADGAVGINLFSGSAYSLPCQLKMVERHPLGSQAFIPLSPEPFLVIVAGADLVPRVFVTPAGLGVNYHRGVWHGVLTPLVDQVFVVIDYVGEAPNLEEHFFEEPYEIHT